MFEVSSREGMVLKTAGLSRPWKSFVNRIIFVVGQGLKVIVYSFYRSINLIQVKSMLTVIPL